MLRLLQIMLLYYLYKLVSESINNIIDNDIYRSVSHLSVSSTFCLDNRFEVSHQPVKFFMLMLRSDIPFLSTLLPSHSGRAGAITKPDSDRDQVEKNTTGADKKGELHTSPISRKITKLVSSYHPYCKHFCTKKPPLHLHSVPFY